MRTIIWVFALALLSSLSGLAQTATITATVTDPDSTAWATLNSVNATYAIQLVSASGASIPAGQAFRTDTGATVTNTFTGNLSSSGAFSVSLTVNSYILPASTQWKFTVCPAVSSAACASVTLPVTTSASFSTQLSAATTAPRIGGGQGAFAYNDTEVAAIPNNSYYNITTSALRCYSSSWAACGGGGGGAVTSVFTRTGAVVATSGDYTASQVTGAATSGANSNITSLTGLTTPLSVAQGGTGNALGAGMTLIQTQVTSGSASSVTFSAIPQGYTHLHLVAQYKLSTAGSGNLQVRFNSDSTTAHYGWQLLFGGTSTPGQAGNNSTTAAVIGPGLGGDTCDIYSYSSAVLGVNVACSFGQVIIGTSVSAGTAAGYWNQTSAVTSFVLTDFDSGTFVNGSTFSLYGMQ